MKRKVNLALITIGIVIAGAILVTGITRFGNKNKTEVKDNQPSTSISEQVEQTPETSETDESLTESTIKSELENKENISENEDLHANAGGEGEISLEQTEDGSFKDPAIDHQDENNIISEPVIKGHGTETTTSPSCDQTAEEMGDIGSWDEIEQGADLPTEEQQAEAWGYVAENGAVLH